jgi:hypothetical protein
LPGSLVTVTLPPIMRASLRVIAEAQSGAPEPLGGRGIGLGELFEQLRLLLRRHAYVGVGDGQPNPSAAVADLLARSLTCAILGETPYSITSSARPSSVGGTSRPSALAVLQFTGEKSTTLPSS